MRFSGSLVLAGALIIAGCGGGGSDSAPPVVSPPTSLGIDSGNAVQVLRVSYLAASDSGETVGLVGNSGVASGGSGGVLKTRGIGQLSKPVTTAINSIPFGPVTEPCDANGSMTISGDLANPLTLTPGDTITVDATNCDDGLGETIDGMIEFTVQAFSGDIVSGLYDMTMRLVITDFQVTTPEDTVLGNGDVSVTLNTLNSPAVSAAVNGASMRGDSNSGSETLTNFLTSQSLDAGVTPSPFTQDSSGTLDSTQLGGVVDYSTPVTFQGFDNDYPSSGELLVTGAGNSTVRLIAVDNVNVRIEIDSNGDGTVDETIDTTWDALLA